MKDLKIGESVQSLDRKDGSIQSSRMYFMPHALQHGLRPFQKLFLSSGQNCTLSPDHFVFRAKTNSVDRAKFSERVAVAAGNMAIGDVVWTVSTDNQIRLSTVTAIKQLHAVGLFGPITAQGTLVVDGLVVSSYVHGLIFSDEALHVAAGVLRMISEWVPQTSLPFTILNNFALLASNSLCESHYFLSFD